jgi:hypothetical protein
MITKIKDARILKRMGVPLNTPIEDRALSEEFSQHWARLHMAHDRFISAVLKYRDDGKWTQGNWKRFKQSYKALGDEANRCDTFLGKLAGIKSPDETVSFKSEQDANEAQLLSYFLAKRAVPFLQYWQDVIAALESGREVEINPADVPRWFDPEPEDAR